VFGRRLASTSHVTDNVTITHSRTRMSTLKVSVENANCHTRSRQRTIPQLVRRPYQHSTPPLPPSWPDGTADGADNYYLLGRGCDRIMIRPPIMPISRIMTSTNGLLNGPNTSTLSLEILLFIVNSAGPVCTHQALRRKRKDQRKKFTKMFNTYLPQRLIFLLGVVFHQH
jgi:hypothetical protein